MDLVCAFGEQGDQQPFAPPFPVCRLPRAQEANGPPCLFPHRPECEHGGAVRRDRTRSLLFIALSTPTLFVESSSRCLAYKKQEPDDLSIIGLFL